MSQEAFLPFALPTIGEAEIAAVVECLQSGWLTTGPRCKQFEADFAAFVGCKYAIAVNSATAALHLALEALDIRADEEVLVPTLTFAATAEVVRYLNARPILIDCDPVTLNLSPQAVEAWLQENAVREEEGAVNRRTGARVRAVMPVHYGGLPCDMEALLRIANEWGLEVVEDAAHALPSRIQGRHVGTFGRANAFSFYANKTITTGEGGMLTTDDEDLAKRARMMSLHGMNRDAWLRFTAQGSWYYEIVAPGFKYNLTDIAAALGLVQLTRAEEFWQARQRLAHRYASGLACLPEVMRPAGPRPGDTHAWHLYAIRILPERLTIDRAQVIEELKARGIGTSVHYMPLHIHPYYRDNYGYLPDDLPNAKRAYEGLITLPLYPRMTEADVDRVLETLSEIVECHRK